MPISPLVFHYRSSARHLRVRCHLKTGAEFRVGASESAMVVDFFAPTSFPVPPRGLPPRAYSLAFPVYISKRILCYLPRSVGRPQALCGLLAVYQPQAPSRESSMRKLIIAQWTLESPSY